ncbi:MAG TPA: FAD-dependent monooxygenase, partial [Acidimicrobiales bacterium]
PRVFDPNNLQICDPARPTTVVSGGPGRRRWEFMRLPGERLEDLNEEARAWELLAPWDVHPGNARLERHAVYTFNARFAERWRTGRVVIAGDAAHLMPPFAGQGLCSGLRDVANLAWKLHFVLGDLAAESLLDSYEEERLPSARAAIEFSMELGKVICVPDHAEAAARDEAMAAGVGDEPVAAPGLPDLTSGFIHPTAPHAGTQLVQGCDCDRRFDDRYGNGWRLVTLGADIERVDPELRAWFATIGGRVVALSAPDQLFARWFAEHDTICALARPDFYLYGTAPTAEDAAMLLADLRRHLERGTTT